MGQILRKFEQDGVAAPGLPAAAEDRAGGVIEGAAFGGCFEPTVKKPKHPPKHPQSTPTKWLSSGEVERLSQVAGQVVRRALAKRSWRGSELVVREEQTGRGRGGKTLLVHVDSLPADVRELWYLEQGIKLHERVDPATGATLQVPGEAFQNSPKFDADLELARWKHDVIRPALALPKGSTERSTLLLSLSKVERRFPDGKRKAVTKAALYNWIRAYEAEGLSGLIRKRRADNGGARQKITRAWDCFFEPHIDDAAASRVADELTGYIRSMWASGERGWRAISEKSTTRLIEISRDLRVVEFDQLDLGRCGDTNAAGTQFGICCVNRRQVEKHRDYGLIAVKNKDNATFHDKFMPTIRRDYSALLPRQIVVGDVHPVDIMMRREDGSEVYPKAIAWYDVATNEIHMTFVLLEKREGVRREHVAQSFEAMVSEWGLPELLYLDNGSEYSWDAMIDGFTQLSKLTKGSVKVFDLDGDASVADRVAKSRAAVVRSLPYNATGKPGIEGVFGNLEQVFFATIPGWTAGDRMRKKTHAKGKDPIAFPGGESAFLATVGEALEWYHKRPQHGRLKGLSPNEALRGFIDGGWGKTTLARPEVLALAFSEEARRTPDRGRVSYTPPRGTQVYYYADELLGIDREITLRIPAHNPDYVFCFEGEELLCQAFPERTYGVLDRAGAEEGNRRGKQLRRKIAEKRAHVSLLSLVDETARHIAHMPDAPEAPVAATVSTEMLDRLALLDAEAREASVSAAAAKRRQTPPEQWATGPNELLQNFKFAKE